MIDSNMKSTTIFKYTLVFFLFVCPLSALANVAFLNTNTAVRSVTSPLSTSFSVTAGGSNTVAFLCLAYDGDTNSVSSAVTYGGQTMTSAGTVSHNTAFTHPFAEVYYLVNPPTGPNTLSASVSGTIQEIYANLVTFTGVNQAAPIRSGTYAKTDSIAFNASSQLPLTVTSNVVDLTMTCIEGGAQAINTSSQTSDGLVNLGTDSMGSDHSTTAAASVTHTWTVGGTTGSGTMVGFSINGTANPAGPGPLNRLTLKTRLRIMARMIIR
jgi:hypothetical protein